MTGVMWAVLNWGGIIPELRDLFMMRVIMSTKLLECSFTGNVGNGSNMHPLADILVINSETSASVISLK